MDKPSEECVNVNAVEIEFLKEALSVTLIGMNTY